MKRRDPPMRFRNGGRQRGLTVVELIAAAGILLILAATALPLARWDEKRRREAQLRMSLETLRTAIDRYKEYADRGLIVQEDVEQMGYPLELDELVDGVEIGDPESAEPKTLRFLTRIPVDPFTEQAEWGLRSYQDDWDSTSWGGENVYDVYSLSELRALDGTYYKDW
jgi:general secretion pathway protein G